MFSKMNMKIKNFETGKWITDKEELIDAMNEVIKGNKNYSLNANAVYITIDYIKNTTIEAIKNKNYNLAWEGTNILKQLNY
jgi:hypothetical protein